MRNFNNHLVIQCSQSKKNINQHAQFKAINNIFLITYSLYFHITNINFKFGSENIPQIL